MLLDIILSGSQSTVKKYFTDNAAATGSHTSRPFGKTWKGMTRGSVVGTHIS